MYKMCREGESNSHGLLRTILSRVRLPIPPSRRIECYSIFQRIKKAAVPSEYTIDSDV